MTRYMDFKNSLSRIFIVYNNFNSYLYFIFKTYFFQALNSPSTSSLVDNSHEQVDQNQQVKQITFV